MNRSGRRIGPADEAQMVRELEKWALGHLGRKLTWRTLEKRFGFSRQSMQAKLNVKAAYDAAKAALTGGLKNHNKKVKDNDTLSREIDALKRVIEAWEKRDVQWKQRYQRIAFHIRQNGGQLYEVDKNIETDGKLPTQRETANILKPFDNEIPPTGR